jgi:hypothetical protein
MGPVGSLVESLFCAPCESQGVVVGHVTKCTTACHAVARRGTATWRARQAPEPIAANHFGGWPGMSSPRRLSIPLASHPFSPTLPPRWNWRPNARSSAYQSEPRSSSVEAMESKSGTPGHPATEDPRGAPTRGLAHQLEGIRTSIGTSDIIISVRVD